MMLLVPLQGRQAMLQVVPKTLEREMTVKKKTGSSNVIESISLCLLALLGVILRD